MEYSFWNQILSHVTRKLASNKIIQNVKVEKQKNYTLQI